MMTRSYPYQNLMPAQQMTLNHHSQMQLPIQMQPPPSMMCMQTPLIMSIKMPQIYCSPSDGSCRQFLQYIEDKKNGWWTNGGQPPHTKDCRYYNNNL